MILRRIVTNIEQRKTKSSGKRLDIGSVCGYTKGEINRKEAAEMTKKWFIMLVIAAPRGDSAHFCGRTRSV